MSLQTRISQEAQQRIRIRVSGRLDTITAPQLEDELNEQALDQCRFLLFDFEALDYISSAGLRVIFKAVKTVKGAGGQSGVLKMQPQIKKVFDIVKALPDVPIFKDDKEMDEYLDAMQSAED